MVNCYARLIGKWRLVMKWLRYILWWSPAQLRKFSTEGLQKLFWEFQYTLDSPVIVQLFTINVILYAVLELLVFIPYIELMKDPFSHVINGLGMLLHLIFLGIKLVAPKVFKHTYLAFVIISIVLYRGCLYSILHSRNIAVSPVINSFMVILVLMIVLYFQTNTIFVVIGVVNLPEIVLYNYLSMASGDNFRVTEIVVQCVIAGGLIAFGLIIHVVTSLEKQLVFDRIIKSVLGHIILKYEVNKQESLLGSLFPQSIAKEVQNSLKDRSNQYMYTFRQLHISQAHNVSILFADIKGFTALSSRVTAQQLVQILNELFARFDFIAKKNHCLRIKILGDCYYCVSGLYDNKEDHASSCVKVGLHMIDIVRFVSMETGYNLSMRVGIHSGTVMCGIIGLKKLQFDVWSTDVTIANQMEASGLPGKVHISEQTLKYLKGSYTVAKANGASRSSYIKAKKMVTYFITKEKLSCSVNYNKDNAHKPRLKLSSRSNTKSRLNSTDYTINMYTQRNKSLLATDDVSMDERITASSSTSTLSTAVDATHAADERRQYGMADIHTTLGMGIKRSSSNITGDISVSEQLSSSTNFRETLSNVITASHIKSLWQKYTTCTMKFKDHKYELEFVQSHFLGLHFFALLLLLLQVIFYLTQLLVLPRSHLWVHLTSTLSLCTLIVFSIASISFLKPLKHHSFLVAIRKDLETNRRHRYITIVSLWYMVLLTITVGLSECTANAPLPLPYDNKDFQNDRCDYPEYHNIMVLILVTFINLPFADLPLIASILMSGCGFFHLLLISQLFLDVFQLSHTLSLGNFSLLVYEENLIIELSITVTQLIIGLIITYKYWLAKRINFLLEIERQECKDQVKAVKTHNFSILRNLLPDHVIKYFLNPDISTMDLYCQSHKEVGVMFACIPEYEKYSEQFKTAEECISCLRLLNEIFSDFDELLDQERFSSIEKIKTIGSTYMVASGIQERHTKRWKHLAALANLTFALKEKLDDINKAAFTDFNLKIGISHGPVVAGVIGAKKPQYDIWGDTVNMASRMASTGVLAKTQVSVETKNILESFGFTFEFNGGVYVKGKGEVITFFLLKSQETGNNFMNSNNFPNL